MFLLCADNGNSYEDHERNVLLCSNNKETLKEIIDLISTEYSILKQMYNDEKDILNQDYDYDAYTAWELKFSKILTYKEEFVCNIEYQDVAYHNYYWFISEIKEF